MTIAEIEQTTQQVLGKYNKPGADPEFYEAKAELRKAIPGAVCIDLYGHANNQAIITKDGETVKVKI